jgi:probable rRNA maturation factor
MCRVRGGRTEAAASRRLLEALRAATRRRRAGLTLLLASDREVRTLNRRFLGRDRTTDVLSFPSGGERDGGAPYLGDIAVSLPRARVQARRARWPLRSEMALLLTHGYLHLLGHDHETDDGAMHRLEARLLRRVAGVHLERRALPWGDSFRG